jgi:octaprenyl-diphosphate synthase
MSLDEARAKPHERLATAVAPDMVAVNALIRERMASEHAPRIPEVTAHLVEAGGKRLRPMLTLAAARMCGYDGPYHIHLAATVEFIHTATLLHDDVVDESRQRRGRPTANLLWDNKSSVLVGDYLFARSFQLMVETGSLRVLDILSNAAAVIAEGEVLQLTAAANLATTEGIYLRSCAARPRRSSPPRPRWARSSQGATRPRSARSTPTATRSGSRSRSSTTSSTTAGTPRPRARTWATISANGSSPSRSSRRSPKRHARKNAPSGPARSRRGDQQDGDLDHALALLAQHGTMEATRPRGARLVRPREGGARPPFRRTRSATC